MDGVKKFLKKKLNEKNKLYSFLSYLYNIKSRYWKPKVLKDFNPIISDQFDKIKDVVIVQIGSNDGKSNDPLYEYIINNYCFGILIEPVKYLFDKLQKNYQDIPDIHFENLAISNTNSFQEFFCIREKDDDKLPDWYNQLSSFKLETIMAHKEIIPNLEQLIEKTTIKTATLHSIVKKYNLKKIDILHIDTEGYDFEIIKTINFNYISPSVLMFEHKHLTDKDYFDCLKILKMYYKKIRRNTLGDTICFKRK